MTSTPWKPKISSLFESLRDEFVKSDDYRGLDLDFRTAFLMKTGLSNQTFDELNDLSISVINKK